MTHAFIAQSAEAENTERVQAEAQQARTRRMERLLFRGAIAVAVVFAVAAILTGWQYFVAKRAQQSAEPATIEANARRVQAETAERIALDDRSQLLLVQAAQQLRAADFTGALKLLGNAVQDNPKIDRGTEVFRKRNA